MAKQTFFSKLPALMLALGVTALGTRWMLYLQAVDHKGLLISGHPLALLLWGLTIGALALAILSRKWPQAAAGFAPAPAAALGHLLAAAGILAAVLPAAPGMAGVLGSLWKLLGLLSCPCLLAAGFCRWKGRRPFFLLHIAPCLFLVFHIINHYQLWSSQPQMIHYLHSFLGSGAMVFFSFHTAAWESGMPSPRIRTGMGLAAIFLCTAALVGAGQELWLYLGLIAWAFTDLTLPQASEAEETAP